MFLTVDAGIALKVSSAVDETTPTPDPILRRLYPREEALLKRLASGDDTPELRAELAEVRAAIRRRLRRDHGSLGGGPENDGGEVT